MDDFFLLSFLASGFLTILGLFSPSKVSKLVRRELSRKSVLSIFGGASFLSFILFGLTVPPSETLTSDATNQLVEEAPEMIPVNDIDPDDSVITDFIEEMVFDAVEIPVSETSDSTQDQQGSADPDQVASEPVDRAEPPSESTQEPQEATVAPQEELVSDSQPSAESAPLPSSSCSCSSNTYNCGDFSSHAQAQELYLCCMAQVGYDVHRLDRDDDGDACESL